MAAQPCSPADTSVVLVDDPTLLAETLRTALSIAGYDVHWIPADSASLDLIGSFSVRGRDPTIAVLGLELHGWASAPAVLERLVARDIKVVVRTVSDDNGTWAACLELGAAVVLPVTVPLMDVVATIDQLAVGHEVTTRHEHGRLHRARDLRPPATDA